MANVRQEEFYAVTQELPDIEPYREYRGEVILVASSYEAAMAGNGIVAAEDYTQGTQGGKVTKAQHVDRVPEVERITGERDPLLDPFESPMLDNYFDEDAFTPEGVIFTDENSED